MTVQSTPPAAPPRTDRALRAGRRVTLAIVWLVAILVIAVGGAGIVAQWSHPPGTFARDELTWAGDQAASPQLDAAQVELQAIAADVDRLSILARGALGAITADEPEPFREALDEGRTVARAIQDASTSLEAQLLALPGGDPLDRLSYGIDVFARRSAMLNALDATEGLGRSWAALTAGGLAASQLLALLEAHDVTVASAAERGRDGDYVRALEILAEAARMLDEAGQVRDQVENTSNVATLDEWLGRMGRYDAALTELYAALRDSGGIVTDRVRKAYREESGAREDLPPDTRGLVLIVADIGRGGLNQAVIAIEQARGRLNLALEALGPVDGRS